MTVPVGDLRPGQEFVTCLTKRGGTVLEVRRRYGVEVCMDAAQIGEVVWLHHAVRVEVVP